MRIEMANPNPNPEMATHNEQHAKCICHVAQNGHAEHHQRQALAGLSLKLEKRGKRGKGRVAEGRVQQRAEYSRGLKGNQAVSPSVLTHILDNLRNARCAVHQARDAANGVARDGL
jgi:hypothetical protein